MKHKDIVTLLISGFIGGVLSFVISNVVFGSSADRSANVKVVTPITTEFVEPDERYFNNKSINPTQLIRIQNNEDDKNLFKDE